MVRLTDCTPKLGELCNQLCEPGNFNNGRDVDAELPDGMIFNMFVNGNAVYFTSLIINVYKAFLNSRGVIEVSHVEYFLGSPLNGYHSKEIDGHLCAYRICDDPERKNIPIDLSRSELNGAKVVGIHRGKAIYNA
ncbi:hypothetical protein PMAYCL1PPCAC_09365 [Pristionchus mayeri]|uniref:Uncharacterized protein n=1 Tax=Pristionchus mayeri TaxID=1317129 RepID=A0AAN5CC69_9BILA|nr:hypothetical protein PMAYCL1PPCAC_09365 [Pristionchus mayeri]